MCPHLNGREVCYLYNLLPEVGVEDLVDEYRSGEVCEAVKLLKTAHS